ncbi:hypothetical protein D3C81_2341460 [compost metagenome]
MYDQHAQPQIVQLRAGHSAYESAEGQCPSPRYHRRFQGEYRLLLRQEVQKSVAHKSVSAHL